MGLSLALLVALFLLLPIAIVVPMSFSTAISFEFPPPGYSLGTTRSTSRARSGCTRR
jgi:ABC-type spermidine/putrescine transport system permease subunit II